jgi:hypothetical protein
MFPMAKRRFFAPLIPLILVLAAFFAPAQVLLGDGTTASAKAKPAALFLAQAKNNVSVVHAGKKLKAVPPQALVAADRIVTGKNSKAYLQFADGGIVEVGPDTDVKVGRLEVTPRDFKARFLLAWGKLKAEVKKLSSSSSAFEIEAGGVVMGVRGTIFGVDFDKVTRQVSAKTFEGSIFSLAGGKEQVIKKGISMLVGKDGIPVLGPLTAGDIKSFTEFSNVSDLLNKKKDELIKQLENKALEKIPQGILPQKQTDDLKDSLRKKLPF